MGESIEELQDKQNRLLRERARVEKEAREAAADLKALEDQGKLVAALKKTAASGVQGARDLGARGVKWAEKKAVQASTAREMLVNRKAKRLAERDRKIGIRPRGYLLGPGPAAEGGGEPEQGPLARRIHEIIDERNKGVREERRVERGTPEVLHVEETQRPIPPPIDEPLIIDTRPVETGGVTTEEGIRFEPTIYPPQEPVVGGGIEKEQARARLREKIIEAEKELQKIYKELEEIRARRKARSEAAPQTPETQIFSTSYIEQSIRKLLEAENGVGIEYLTILGSGNELVLNARITATKYFITTNIKLENACLENRGDNVGLREGYILSATKAEGKVKDIFTKHINSIGVKLKEYIEKEEQKKVKRIWIEDGRLKVTFDK